MVVIIIYKLKRAKKENISLLIKYKLSTILEYDSSTDENIKNNLITYINEKISKQIDNYKLIIVDSKLAGCLLVEEYNDGVILDEIYLEGYYRNKGIGSKIIENLIMKNEIIYLWVYKENERAIKLYERFNFKVIEESNTRFLMVYKK